MPEAQTILDPVEETPQAEAPKPEVVQADHAPTQEEAIQIEYRGLKEKLKAALDRQNFWHRTLKQSPYMRAWIEEQQQALDKPVLTALQEEGISPKDLPAFVAKLEAKAWILEELGRLTDIDEVAAIRHEITTFENNNALFLQDRQDSPEVVEPAEVDEAAEAIDATPESEAFETEESIPGDDTPVEETEPARACYLKSIDKKGLAKLSVGEIEKGEWATFSQIGTGAASRFTSKDLPVRDTREEAQADLDAYAVKLALPNADEE